MERLKKRQAKVLTAAVVMSVLFVVGIQTKSGRS